MAAVYFKGASAVICVFDRARLASLHAALGWADAARARASPTTVVVLVAAAGSGGGGGDAAEQPAAVAAAAAAAAAARPEVRLFHLRGSGGGGGGGEIGAELLLARIATTILQRRGLPAPVASAQPPIAPPVAQP